MQTSENGNSSFVTDDNEGVHNMMTKEIIYRSKGNIYCDDNYINNDA